MWRKVGMFAANFILMAAASLQSLTLANCLSQYEQYCTTYNECPWGCTTTVLTTYPCCCTRATYGGCCQYTCAETQCSGPFWCYGTQTVRNNGIVRGSGICYASGSCY